MTAGHAESKVDPAVARFHAFLAAAGVGSYFVYLIRVRAFRHMSVSLWNMVAHLMEKPRQPFG